MTRDITGADWEHLLEEGWSTPLEAGVRGTIRGFIEALLEEELEAALGRGRYARLRTAAEEPAATAAPTSRNHGCAGVSAAASTTMLPTRTARRASGRVTPVSTRTISSGVRYPLRCASPPGLLERRPISPAIMESNAATARRAGANPAARADNSVSLNRANRAGSEDNAPSAVAANRDCSRSTEAMHQFSHLEHTFERGVEQSWEKSPLMDM